MKVELKTRMVIGVDEAEVTMEADYVAGQLDDVEVTELSIDVADEDATAWTSIFAQAKAFSKSSEAIRQANKQVREYERDIGTMRRELGLSYL